MTSSIRNILVFILFLFNAGYEIDGKGYKNRNIVG